MADICRNWRLKVKVKKAECVKCKHMLPENVFSFVNCRFIVSWRFIVSLLCSY